MVCQRDTCEAGIRGHGLKPVLPFQVQGMTPSFRVRCRPAQLHVLQLHSFQLFTKCSFKLCDFASLKPPGMPPFWPASAAEEQADEQAELREMKRNVKSDLSIKH